MTGSDHHDDHKYDRLVHNLVLFESVEQIQERARRYGTDAERLRVAFATAAARAAERGRPAERELLRHVASVTARASAPEGAEADEGLPPAVQTALAAARATDSLLSACRLLTDVRQQLTDEVWQRLSSSVLSRASIGADPKPLTLLYVTALATGRPEPRCTALLLLARHYAHQVVIVRAARYYRRAITIARASGDPRLVFEACGPYATWLYNGNSYQAAIPFYEEALAAAELALTKPFEQLQTLRTRRGLASAHERLGNLQEALHVVAEALDHLSRDREFFPHPFAVDAQKIRAVDEEDLQLRRLRALIHVGLDELDLAQADMDDIAADARQRGQWQMLFEVLVMRTELATGRGDAALVESMFRQALQVATGWGDNARIAAAHNNLGHFCLDRGRLDDAQRTFLAALWYGGVTGVLNASTVISYVGLGDVFRERGNNDLAMGLYGKAMEHLPPTDLDAILLVAHRLMTDDQWWSSRISGLYENAIKASPGQLGVADLARLTDAYAWRRAGEGQRDKAVEYLRHAIGVIRQQSPQARELLQLEHSLARLLAQSEESLPEAHRLLTRVVAEQQARATDTLSTGRKSEIVADGVAAHGALIGLLVDHSGHLPGEEQPVARAFALHEAAKSRSLVAHLGRITVRPPEAVPADLVQRERDLLELERGLLAGGGGRSYTERRRRFRDVDVELRRCWSEMRPSAEPYVRMRSGEPAGLAEVTALLDNLPHRTAVASFFCDESTTTCFVLQPDVPLSVTRLPVGRERWARAGAALRRQFNGAPTEWPPYPPIRRDRPGNRGLAVLDELGRDIAVLLAPVRDVDLLCIAPHGPLHLLPLHALPDTDGRYPVERHGVVYVPSLTTLLHAVVGRRERPDGPLSAYVAGVAADGDDHPEFFERDEAVFDSTGVRVLARNGPQRATPGDLLTELPKHDVVHLTCHGYFDHRSPLRSGLLLGDGERRPPRALNQVSVRERRPFLTTAEDLLGTRLRAEIVTLRACSSGVVGERNAGDEFDGLTRSFIQSGAGAVLAGQWNVDQRSSHRLVSSFYRHWLGSPTGTPKWQALRRAQLELLNDTAEPYLRHPYHWAALALLGDWR